MEEKTKATLDKQNGNNKDRIPRILSESLIKATDTYQTPPQIIWVDNSTIATLGNFSASTGKAKAKKTFNVSALVAASLANGKVLNYRASLPEGKRKILYVDTEQSRYHCHNVLERILKLAGLPTSIDNENLDFICLREYTPSVRIEVIEHREALSEVFKDQPIKGYENVVLAMIPAYEEIGYKRGRSVMAKLLQYLVTELKLVVKRDKMFFYDLTPTEADLFCDDE